MSVGVDCEMVRTRGGRKALARVCLVSYDEQLLFHSFVLPERPIVDYETRYSGVTAASLEGAPSLEEVRSEVLSLVRGRPLIGHALHNDLHALRIDHPSSLTVDTQKLQWGERRSSLRSLCHELLAWDIQSGAHHPQEDAIASIRLLKWYLAHGPPPPRLVQCTLVSCEPCASPADAPCCTVTSPADDDGELGLPLSADVNPNPKPNPISMRNPDASPKPAPSPGAGAARSLRTEWGLSFRWSAVAVTDLLEWLAAEAHLGGARELLFDPHLSKEDRQTIHKAAAALGLGSLSAGIGNERAIRVLSNPGDQGGQVQVVLLPCRALPCPGMPNLALTCPDLASLRFASPPLRFPSPSLPLPFHSLPFHPPPPLPLLSPTSSPTAPLILSLRFPLQHSLAPLAIIRLCPPLHSRALALHSSPSPFLPSSTFHSTPWPLGIA
ncbi:MAG: hypothetical protein SGPRY_007045 [Prymnesium sp.]